MKTNWLQLLTTTIFTAKQQCLLRPHMHLVAFPRHWGKAAAYLMCLRSFLMLWFPFPWTLPQFRLMIKMDHCLKFQFDVQSNFLELSSFMICNIWVCLDPIWDPRHLTPTERFALSLKFLRGNMILPVYKVQRCEIRVAWVQKWLLPILWSYHQ